MMDKRFTGATWRISEIPEENCLEGQWKEYFKKNAEYLLKMVKENEWVLSGKEKEASLEELKQHNFEMYEDILPQNYENSFANPAFAAECFGKEFGQLLSFLAAELRSFPAFVYENDREAMTIRMELFLEVYHAFCYAFEENKAAEKQEDRLPAVSEISEMIYWFASDYSETMLEKRLRQMYDWEADFAVRIIMDSDLSDIRYLYRYGEYVTENEIRMAQHLNSLSQEDIDKMADTYTEGFRMGFELAGKPLHKKRSVNIRYFLGFERVIKKAIENFEKLSLHPVIYRANPSVTMGRSVYKTGYAGASANKQFDFDHENDAALFCDSKFIHHKLECYRNGMEAVKEKAVVHAGPAVMEVFGAVPFEPKTKSEACTLDENQQKLQVEFQASCSQIVREYVKPEERSFTIIAFPVPEIGDNFPEIFNRTVEINILDYKLYQKIQQTLIDALDQAEYVKVKGCGENCTDLKVMLHTLKNPEKETNFENCVADVNIPVGEVFTSPKLAGTDGVLHVTEVYLNDLRYQNLKLTFKDGMITDYTCSNFEKEEENRKLIKDKVLFHHDTLPIGEFAIGTNTTAYVFAGEYQIADKLPILIAEKMGPHFAVGDTCYSHEEDMMTYNPDGKAIVARENEVSALRHADPDQAYFNCHTDITIPYDELGELTAVTADGRELVIIRNGRFVLPGCEELNKPFE